MSPVSHILSPQHDSMWPSYAHKWTRESLHKWQWERNAAVWMWTHERDILYRSSSRSSTHTHLHMCDSCNRRGEKGFCLPAALAFHHHCSFRTDIHNLVSIIKENRFKKKRIIYIHTDRQNEISHLYFFLSCFPPVRFIFNFRGICVCVRVCV